MATQLAPVPEYVVEETVTSGSITGRVTRAMRYFSDSVSALICAARALSALYGRADYQGGVVE